MRPRLSISTCVLLLTSMALFGQNRPLIAVVGETMRLQEMRRQLVKLYDVAEIPVKGQPVFPPLGTAYKENEEAHRVWRAIHVAAPDAVIMLGEYPGLVEALRGQVPVTRGAPFDRPKPSRIRLEMQERLARSPRQLAEELGGVYGHEFKDAVYIPAVALMGRLQLGAQAEVEALVLPYINGTRRSLEKPTASHLAGHLVFAELARRTRDPRYIARVKAAADLAFEKDGKPREAMPLHNEMSDAVFMGAPILAEAARLTGDAKYLSMAIRHLRFVEKLCLRPDGLYRHSPLNETAWGRGNAFPALGMALLLEAMPQPDAGVLESFRTLMATLQSRQDSAGMWHQIIDEPDSYAEFSATAMIATAMLKGIRAGWLERATYQPRVEAAWRAIKARTSREGVLMDVCESTGKQTTKLDYLRRAAIWDKDPRGGAMALLLATELMKD